MGDTALILAKTIGWSGILGAAPGANKVTSECSGTERAKSHAVLTTNLKMEMHAKGTLILVHTVVSVASCPHLRTLQILPQFSHHPAHQLQFLRQHQLQDHPQHQRQDRHLHTPSPSPSPGCEDTEEDSYC